ncbi:MAG TPA: hypothetical protein VJ654_03315 [Noviherbaspirillum sp.]|nr:hypothetical protein [Noviherbaspirillum sp.]
MNFDIKQLLASGIPDYKEYLKNFPSWSFFQGTANQAESRNALKSLMQMVEDMWLPKAWKAWLKDRLIEEMSDALPSEKCATQTMKRFLKNELYGAKISVEQMKEVADTGYLTKKNGMHIKVSEKVQRAAQAFMANGGELFARVESAGNGKHNGLLTIGDIDCAMKKHLLSSSFNEFDYGALFAPTPCKYDTLPSCWEDLRPSEKSAARTIQHLQMHFLGGGVLTVEQMDLMAKTGYLKKPDGSLVFVSEKERAAAQTFMASGGALFARIESVKHGVHDGKMTMSDIKAARVKGKLSGPRSFIDDEEDIEEDISIKKAVISMLHFMKSEAGCATLSVAQLEEIAKTGYLTKADGTRIRMIDTLQKSASKMMEDDGSFLAMCESATSGGYDGKLSVPDIERWLKKLEH